MTKTETLNILATSKTPAPKWQIQETLQAQHHEQMLLLRETAEHAAGLNHQLKGLAKISERLLQTANRLEQSPDQIRSAVKMLPRPLRPLQVVILCVLTALITAVATAAWVHHTVAAPVIVIDTATLTQQLAEELKRQ